MVSFLCSWMTGFETCVKFQIRLQRTLQTQHTAFLTQCDV